MNVAYTLKTICSFVQLLLMHHLTQVLRVMFRMSIYVTGRERERGGGGGGVREGRVAINKMSLLC